MDAILSRKAEAVRRDTRELAPSTHRRCIFAAFASGREAAVDLPPPPSIFHAAPPHGATQRRRNLSSRWHVSRSLLFRVSTQPARYLIKRPIFCHHAASLISSISPDISPSVRYSGLTSPRPANICQCYRGRIIDILAPMH